MDDGECFPLWARSIIPLRLSLFKFRWRGLRELEKDFLRLLAFFIIYATLSTSKIVEQMSTISD